MFHAGDWDLFFFPVSWEFLVGQYRLADRCVQSLICLHVVQLEPPASAFTIFGVFGCVCFVASVLLLCLDEDCNPGWGDCGRLLRRFRFLLKMVNWRLHFVHWRLDY